jgi:hypothetical protein
MTLLYTTVLSLILMLNLKSFADLVSILRFMKMRNEMPINYSYGWKEIKMVFVNAVLIDRVRGVQPNFVFFLHFESFSVRNYGKAVQISIISLILI